MKIHVVKSKIFTKNFTMFLIPILIPILILGSLSILITYRYVANEIEQSNKKSLNTASENIEILFDEVDSLDINFGINPEITVPLKRILNNQTLTDQDLFELDIIKSLMNGPAYSKPYINSVYIYFDNPDKSYISTYEGLVKLGNSYDTTWYDDYKKNNSVQECWLKLREVKRYEFEQKSVKLLTVYRNLSSYSGSKSSGVIVLNLNLAYIENLLNSLKTYPDQNIVVLNQSNDIICQSTGKNQIQQSDIKKIIKKDNDFGLSKIFNNSSVFSETVSKKYGLKYVSVVPRQKIYAVPLNLIKVTLLLLIISLLISLSLTYYVTKINYKRIQDIISIIDLAKNGEKLPPLPDKIHDEYGYIVFNVLKGFLEQSYLKVQLSERKYKLHTMELLALQAQISPHFLFNTLQTINFKVLALTKKPNEVNTMIENLSDILKYSLSNPTETITLKEEIDNVESYIAIQKIRYRDKFEFILQCDEKIKFLKVPKLIFQPLIENSIYHGIKEKEGTSKIKIRVDIMGKSIKISIIDSGLGISREKLYNIRELLNSNTDSSEHIGLYNTDKRLKLMYGENNGVKISSKLGFGTVIYINIPLNEGDKPKGDVPD